MRSCNSVRLQQSQWYQYPILPFLAPRAFAPWPEHLRQPRSQYQQASNEECVKARKRLSINSRTLSQSCIPEQPAGSHARLWPSCPITVKRHFYSAIALQDAADNTSTSNSRDIEEGRRYKFVFAGKFHSDVAPANLASGPLNIFEDEDEQATNKASRSSRDAKDQQVAQQWYSEMVQGDSGATLFQSWDALTSEMKSYRWSLMVTWLSEQRSVDTAWNFIARTVRGLSIPAEELQQTLLQATVAIAQASGKARLRQIAYNVYLALQSIPDEGGQLMVPTKTLRFLASYSKGSSVKAIYEFLRARKVEIRPSVILRFASRFAQLQDPHTLELLESVAFSPQILHSEHMLNICGLIIENSADRRSATKTDAEILSRIMKLGVPMKTRLANALIKNAAACGSVETAMRLYSRLQDGGQLQPDSDTHLLLLPHLRTPATLGWFLEIQRGIRRKGIQYIDQEVAHELMYARYQHTKSHHFDLMLGLYEVQFSLIPLKQLGIIRGDYEAHRQDYLGRFCGPLPLPKRNIMELMLHIFAYSKPRRVLPIVEVYRNLIKLRNSGDPLFLLLARRLTSWAIILKSLCRHEGTLRAWPQVLRDMESPALNSRGQPYTHPRTGRPWLPPLASSPRLWNIIVNGYTKRGFMNEAERVLELMSQRRVEPDLHTFAPLLKGYAVLQDIRGIERTLRKVEVAGHRLEMDGHVDKALEHFKDKALLARALDDSAIRRLDPYAARAADELFESEEMPAPPGSKDEFDRWDMFANASQDKRKEAVDAEMKEVQKSDVKETPQDSQLPFSIDANTGLTANIDSLEDRQADMVSIEASRMDAYQTDSQYPASTFDATVGHGKPQSRTDTVDDSKQDNPDYNASGWAMLASEDWDQASERRCVPTRRQEQIQRFEKDQQHL